ncbi:MAG: dihydrofolate reductase [Saprospiraceae bacterium]|jgi:dihydrofolate reductase|nr:dihydrofolate reductase [Saprospiraceae bacterium]
MRKLKLQVQMTIDGFISGENGEMDWMMLNWTNDIKEYVTEITEPVDTILLGRKLAEGFIPHWTEALKTNEEGAKKFVDTPKIVFSKTLTHSEWDKTTIANGELENEINQIKNQDGGDIIAYGGGRFVSSLIKAKLIDEFHLFVNPVIIGKGMQIFHLISEKQNFELVGIRQFDCGIVLLIYRSI